MFVQNCSLQRLLYSQFVGIRDRRSFTGPSLVNGASTTDPGTCTLSLFSFQTRCRGVRLNLVRISVIFNFNWVNPTFSSWQIKSDFSDDLNNLSRKEKLSWLLLWLLLPKKVDLGQNRCSGCMKTAQNFSDFNNYERPDSTISWQLKSDPTNSW